MSGQGTLARLHFVRIVNSTADDNMWKLEAQNTRQMGVPDKSKGVLLSGL